MRGTVAKQCGVALDATLIDEQRNEQTHDVEKKAITEMKEKLLDDDRRPRGKFCDYVEATAWRKCAEKDNHDQWFVAASEMENEISCECGVPETTWNEQIGSSNSPGKCMLQC